MDAISNIPGRKLGMLYDIKRSMAKPYLIKIWVGNSYLYFRKRLDSYDNEHFVSLFNFYAVFMTPIFAEMTPKSIREHRICATPAEVQEFSKILDIATNTPDLKPNMLSAVIALFSRGLPSAYCSICKNIYLARNEKFDELADITEVIYEMPTTQHELRDVWIVPSPNALVKIINDTVYVFATGVFHPGFIRMRIPLEPTKIFTMFLVAGALHNPTLTAVQMAGNLLLHDVGDSEIFSTARKIYAQHPIPEQILKNMQRAYESAWHKTTLQYCDILKS